jgi:gamma-glutamylcysteine synthetase
MSSLHRFFYQLSHSTNINSFSFSSKCQVGLLYDEVSLQNVLDLIADWTMEEREMLRNKVIQI